MGFLDDLNPFKRDDPKVRLLRTPEAEAATKELLGIARRPFDRSTPTAPVAGLSPMEIQADELASQYGGSTPEGLDYLRSLIGKGSFMDDPEYQALFKEVREAGQEETNRVGRSLQQRGGATSSTGRDILGRSVEDMESNLLATSLPYMQQDRSQRIGAANLLSTLGENAMLRRLDALSTRGALQRNLEQLRQQADYERRRKELGHPTEVQAPWYATVAGLPADWSVTQDPSMFEQISPLLQVAGMAAMGSDRNIKENISPVTGALEKVRQLKAHTYNYKAAPGARRVGLIAQDLEAVMPEAVIEIGGVKHVDMYALQSLIVQAIGELAEAGQSL